MHDMMCNIHCKEAQPYGFPPLPAATRSTLTRASHCVSDPGWLVVSTLLKHMSSSIGMMISNGKIVKDPGKNIFLPWILTVKMIYINNLPNHQPARVNDLHSNPVAICTTSARKLNPPLLTRSWRKLCLQDTFLQVQHLLQTWLDWKPCFWLVS